MPSEQLNHTNGTATSPEALRLVMSQAVDMEDWETAEGAKAALALSEGSTLKQAVRQSELGQAIVDAIRNIELL